MTSRVVLVGLGNISTAHLRALEGIASVGSVVGVDPAPRSAPSFRREPLRVHGDLASALAEGADLVVIATPTASHAAVVEAVRAWDESVPILLEKPAADRRADADTVLSGTPAVQVIFHAGFAPEVVWAAGFCASERSRLGDVVTFTAWFGNPYAHDLEHRTASLANSWLDSGINALSVIGRFVVPAGVTSFRSLADHASTFEARFRFGEAGAGHEGTIVTTWQAAGYSQWARLRLESGAELVLDHAAGAATVFVDGAVAEMYTRSDAGPRLDGHYASFYGDYFGARTLQYPARVGRDLHALLFSAVEQLG